MKNNRPNRKFRQINPATLLFVKQFVLGFFVFTVVGLIITGIWYGTRLQTFTISAINVSGGTTISAETVHNKVNDALAGTYLGLVPRRFTFFYPEEEIIETLDDIERLKDVNVEMLNNQTMSVTFDEYVPDSLWCDKAEEVPCLFLDQTGYAFGTSPKLSGGSLIRYYSLDTDLLKEGRPLSEEDYLLTKEFIKMLNDSNWFVSKVEVDSVRDVFYTLANGGEIKATLLDAAEKPFTYLQTLLESDEFSHLEPGNFQYIDLRFGTKVFVNEEKVVDTNEEVVEEGVVEGEVEEVEAGIIN